jgi:hypothetical protein
MGGSLQNAAGTVVALSGGTVNFTYDGTISDTVGGAVSVANSTGGLKDFNGAISGGTVVLGSNSGATIRFDGGLSLTTGAASAFSATGGGTVAVTGGANTLQTTSGTPLTVTNTTIDPDDLTFRTISSSGAANGISLANTGAGSLTVTGSGTPGSGGTIAGSAGPGVLLANVPGGVSLTRMTIQNGADDGVRGTTVTGVTLDTTSVTGNGNAVDEHGLDLSAVNGTVNLTAATVTGNFDRNVQTVTDAGTLTLNVTGGTYANTNESVGDDGIAVEGTGTGTINVTLQNATFTNNRGDHIQVTTDASATVRENVTISGNTMTNPVGEEGGGVTLNPGGNAVMKASVVNNSIQGARLEAISVDTPGSRAAPQPVTVDATIQANTIGASGVANSGASAGNGIGIRSNGNATVRTLVENNTIYQYANAAGILLVNNDSNGTLDATLRNNLIGAPAPGGQNGILATTGGADLAETATSCLALGDPSAPLMNRVASAGSELLSGEDIRIRRFDAATVKLPGYAGGATDTSAVQSFVAARNAGNGAATVGALNDGTPGGFTGGTCTLPQP